MSGLRVGLIGYGLAGETFHAPLIAATAGLELSAIVTTDPERRRRAESAYPTVRLLSAVAELWDFARRLDLIVVASPNAKHVEHAAEAIAAGISVVVDKPFATTALQARALAAAAARAGVMVVPFHNRRWDADFLTVQDLLTEPRLGDIIRFESRFERLRPTPKPRWMEDDAAARAEGILYDIGPHLVDQALVLFGTVTHVYAETDRRDPRSRVEDDAFVALTHASGVRSRLHMSAVAAQSGPRMSLYGTREAYITLGLDPQEEMLKRGRRPGDAGWGEEAPDCWGTIGTGGSTSPVPSQAGAYERFYFGVAEALRADGAPPVEAADAIAGLEIIEAAYRSAAERVVVSLA